MGEFAVSEGDYVCVFFTGALRTIAFHALQTSPQLHERSVDIVRLFLLLHVGFRAVAVAQIKIRSIKI